MLGNDISNKNGCDELKMRKVRVKPWDGKREIREVPHVHIAAGVANFGFEWLSSQRKKGSCQLCNSHSQRGGGLSWDCEDADGQAWYPSPLPPTFLGGHQLQHNSWQWNQRARLLRIQVPEGYQWHGHGKCREIEPRGPQGCWGILTGFSMWHTAVTSQFPKIPVRQKRETYKS